MPDVVALAGAAPHYTPAPAGRRAAWHVLVQHAAADGGHRLGHRRPWPSTRRCLATTSSCPACNCSPTCPRCSASGACRCSLRAGACTPSSSRRKPACTNRRARPARRGQARPLMRAVRLVVDTGLHAFGWSRERAVQYAVDHVPLPPRVHGRGDRPVHRHAWSGAVLPHRQLEIGRLRDEARLRLGPAFSLPGFHAAVLDHGSLPMPDPGPQHRELAGQPGPALNAWRQTWLAAPPRVGGWFTWEGAFHGRNAARRPGKRPAGRLGAWLV